MIDKTLIHRLVSFIALWSCTETVHFDLQPVWSPLKLTVWIQILECFHQKPKSIFDWRNDCINILDDMGWVNYKDILIWKWTNPLISRLKCWWRIIVFFCFCFCSTEQSFVSDGEMNRSRCAVCRYEISLGKQSQAEMRGEPGAHLGKQALGHARHAAGVVVGKQSRVHTLISRDVRYTASVNELNTHMRAHALTYTDRNCDVQQNQSATSTLQHSQI